jgi:hypothetical protein
MPNGSLQEGGIVRFIDDVTLAKLHPNRSRKEQVGNGLRLGIGAGAFLIAVMLLGSGLKRVVSSVPPQHLVWSDWVAWVQICIALVLLFVTAQVWLMVVGGYAFFGLAKVLLVLISGKDFHAPYRPIPRLEALAVAFFALTTLVLLFRFVDTRPSILDRVALTFYVLAIAVGLSGDRAASTLIDSWPTAGLIALAISWCVYRWKTTKPRTPEAQFSR